MAPRWRLEYLLVPLVFGLGAPVASMVGTNIGANQNEARAAHCLDRRCDLRRADRRDRRRRPLCFRMPWLSLFGEDPAMNAVGAQLSAGSSARSTASSAWVSLLFRVAGCGLRRLGDGGSVIRVAIAAIGGLAMVRLGAGTARRVCGSGGRPCPLWRAQCGCSRCRGVVCSTRLDSQERGRAAGGRGDKALFRRFHARADLHSDDRSWWIPQTIKAYVRQIRSAALSSDEEGR